MDLAIYREKDVFERRNAANEAKKALLERLYLSVGYYYCQLTHALAAAQLSVPMAPRKVTLVKKVEKFAPVRLAPERASDPLAGVRFTVAV